MAGSETQYLQQRRDKWRSEVERHTKGVSFLEQRLQEKRERGEDTQFTERSYQKAKRQLEKARRRLKFAEQARTPESYRTAKDRYASTRDPETKTTRAAVTPEVRNPRPAIRTQDDFVRSQAGISAGVWERMNEPSREAVRREFRRGRLRPTGTPVEQSYAVEIAGQTREFSSREEAQRYRGYALGFVEGLNRSAERPPPEEQRPSLAEVRRRFSTVEAAPLKSRFHRVKERFTYAYRNPRLVSETASGVRPDVEGVGVLAKGSTPILLAAGAGYLGSLAPAASLAPRITFSLSATESMARATRTARSPSEEGVFTQNPAYQRAITGALNTGGLVGGIKNRLSQSSFEQSLTPALQREGFTGADLTLARRQAVYDYNTRRMEGVVRAVGVEATSELAGRKVVSLVGSRVGSRVTRVPWLTRYSVASSGPLVGGFVEGAAGSLSDNIVNRERLDVGRAAGFGLAGSAVAGVVGGGIGASLSSGYSQVKGVGRGMNVAANVADIFEYPGDLTADFLEGSARAAGRRVVVPTFSTAYGSPRSTVTFSGTPATVTTPSSAVGRGRASPHLRGAGFRVGSVRGGPVSVLVPGVLPSAPVPSGVPSPLLSFNPSITPTPTPVPSPVPSVVPSPTPVPSVIPSITPSTSIIPSLIPSPTTSTTPVPVTVTTPWGKGFPLVALGGFFGRKRKKRVGRTPRDYGYVAGLASQTLGITAPKAPKPLGGFTGLEVRPVVKKRRKRGKRGSRRRKGAKKK